MFFFAKSATTPLSVDFGRRFFICTLHQVFKTFVLITYGVDPVLKNSLESIQFYVQPESVEFYKLDLFIF